VVTPLRSDMSLQPAAAGGIPPRVRYARPCQFRGLR
jgi:hypothetical protein